MIPLRDVYFSFLPLESFKIVRPTLGCTLRTRKVRNQILATYDGRYYVNYVRRCAAWMTDMEEKQTELKSENK